MEYQYKIARPRGKSPAGQDRQNQNSKGPQESDGIFQAADQLPRFGDLNETVSTLRLNGCPTETIDLASLLTKEVSTTGSFDIRGQIWASTFGKLIQALPIPAFLIDSSSKVLTCNEACCKISSAYEKIVGTPFPFLFPNPGVSRKVQLLLDAVFLTRKTTAGEAVLQIEEGRVWARMTFRPVRIKQDRFVLALIEDLSNEKKQIHLKEIQRAHALTEMGGLVAHNFNNVFQVVMGGAQLALTNLELGNFDCIRNSLQQILQSAIEGAETVKRLQYLVRSRPEDEPLEEVFDLSPVVHRSIEMSKLWWQSNPEKLGIRVVVDRYLEPNCFIKGSSNALFEMVVQLIRKSTEALTSGGRIVVRSFSEDGKAILQVRAGAMGRQKQDIKKASETIPARKPLQGSAMGLDTCRSIVNRHGGEISIDSHEGTESTVIVTLPLCSTRQSELGTVTEEELGPALNILLVDDMEPVLRMLQEGLELGGHKVYATLSGKKAVEIFKQRQVDLVICDLGMPEMNGWQVAKAIKECCMEQRRAKTPFILITGWSSQQNAKDKIAESGVDAVAEKPLELSRLLKITKTIMAREECRTDSERNGMVTRNEMDFL